MSRNLHRPERAPRLCDLPALLRCGAQSVLQDQDLIRVDPQKLQLHVLGPVAIVNRSLTGLASLWRQELVNTTLVICSPDQPP
jgi:hypothetical protein